MDQPANKLEQNTNPPSPKPEWAGLTEIDRLRKAWADPWSRTGIIVSIAAILAFMVFVIVSELSR
jgi:hypothetical protein